MLAGAILFNHLPAQMAVQWGFQTEPNLYSPRVFTLFGLPIIMALIQGLILFACRIQYRKTGSIPKVISVVIWCIPIMSVLVSSLVTMWNLGHTFDIVTLALLPLGTILILVGNYLPKMSYEASKDRISPRPMEEKAFRKTLRITSAVVILIGIALIALALFL
jgi:uncharacterized membrane protein